MTIQLNGKSVELPEHVRSIEDLLKYYKVADRIVIVEINKEIPDKKNYSSMHLSGGDVVEMIHFVGGG